MSLPYCVACWVPGMDPWNSSSRDPFQWLHVLTVPECLMSWTQKIGLDYSTLLVPQDDHEIRFCAGFWTSHAFCTFNQLSFDAATYERGKMMWTGGESGGRAKSRIPDLGKCQGHGIQFKSTSPLSFFLSKICAMSNFPILNMRFRRNQTFPLIIFQFHFVF